MGEGASDYVSGWETVMERSKRGSVEAATNAPDSIPSGVMEVMKI